MVTLIPSLHAFPLFPSFALVMVYEQIIPYVSFNSKEFAIFIIKKYTSIFWVNKFFKKLYL